MGSVTNTKSPNMLVFASGKRGSYHTFPTIPEQAIMFKRKKPTRKVDESMMIMKTLNEENDAPPNVLEREMSGDPTDMVREISD